MITARHIVATAILFLATASFSIYAINEGGATEMESWGYALLSVITLIIFLVVSGKSMNQMSRSHRNNSIAG